MVISGQGVLKGITGPRVKIFKKNRRHLFTLFTPSIDLHMKYRSTGYYEWTFYRHIFNLCRQHGSQ